MQLLAARLTLFALCIAFFVISQNTVSESDGYTGYNLSVDGDNSSIGYETDGTTVGTPIEGGNATLPDVYLNASVSVDEIDIEVDNLTAKVNVDAQVLNLLTFNAGVDVSIDRVKLTIQNVSAKVLLEARLENLVIMISDVLDSIDLNPVIAELGSGLSNVVNQTTTAVGDGLGDLGLKARSANYDITHNILYSMNDYSGNTHTNRILSQNGSIIDVFLNNHGQIYKSNVVGSYSRDMSFTGYNVSSTHGGQPVRELEYIYHPYSGLSIISAIFMDLSGRVVATQVLSESGAGGTSTIDGEL